MSVHGAPAAQSTRATGRLTRREMLATLAAIVAASRSPHAAGAGPAPFALDGRDVHVHASIGVALGGGGTDAEALLRDADTAMYQAKSGAAKKRVACVGDSITQGVGAGKGESYPAQLQKLTDLHTAMAADVQTVKDAEAQAPAA